jgi:predicted  nucleic acid-binding Zn-ribbon protein
VYYHLLTPMLLNELQKEHHRSEAQKSEITSMSSRLARQNAVLAQLNTELASVRQSQRQILTKLAALEETGSRKESVQKAVFAQR